MADRGEERELVFCHACENEWYKDQGGLECPQCHSEVVEVIDRNNDPRNSHIELANNSEDEDEAHNGNADALPHNPLHRHNPWANDAPDPDEGDIEHVAFNPAPGIHFQRTTFRSTSPPGQNPHDAFAPLFSSFAGMFNGGATSPSPPGYGPRRSPFPPPGAAQVHTQHNHLPFPVSPHGGPPIRANVRVFGAGDQSVNSLHAVMQTMLATLQENAVNANNDPHTQHRGQPEGNPFDFLMQTLTQFRDPTRAAHGDAVFTDEALDRIISQMMDQQGGGGSAPGPATATAIAALPKKQADKDMVGTDGKAECSVCMDAVLLGDEVTVLPCKHWFHGECVGAWLKEHDTCPHCRQGIMPKDGPADADAPRSPGQTPRHDQNAWTFGGPSGPGGMPNPSQILGAAQRMARPPPQPGQGAPWTQPGMQQPYVPGGYPAYPEPQNYVQPPFPPQHSGHQPSQMPPTTGSPEGRRQSNSRGSSNGSGSGNGEGGSGSTGSSRVAGWFRNLRGGSSEHR